MSYYLGVDAGGTASKSRLTDALGTILGTGHAGPANTRIGIDMLHMTLLNVCLQATAAAGLSPEQVATVHCGMGIAGINRAGMLSKIEALPFPFGTCTFRSDAMIAHLGAHRGGDGAILILGTGSIGLVKQGGDISSIGGYGFPISDEGSGAALGLSAIRHALRTLDGRKTPTPLSSAIAGNFDHAIPRVIAWMDAATPGEYARFAPLVMDYADAGDDIAMSIVREAAMHVDCFIDTMIARGAEKCVLMGGLSRRMTPWLSARSVALLTAPLGDALEGALILAGKPIVSAPSRP